MRIHKLDVRRLTRQRMRFFTSRQAAALNDEHTPAAIRRRLRASAEHSHLRDFVFGAMDGTVTTFAVVAGVAGAGLPSGIAIVLGTANLLADGFSMAAGNYLSTKTDRQVVERAPDVSRKCTSSKFPKENARKCGKSLPPKDSKGACSTKSSL